MPAPFRVGMEMIGLPKFESKIKSLNPNFAIHLEPDSRGWSLLARPALYFGDRFVSNLERNEIPKYDIWSGEEEIQVHVPVNFALNNRGSIVRYEIWFTEGQQEYSFFNALLPNNARERIVELGHGNEALLYKKFETKDGVKRPYLCLCYFFQSRKVKNHIAKIGLYSILKMVEAANIPGCSKAELESTFGISLTQQENPDAKDLSAVI